MGSFVKNSKKKYLSDQDLHDNFMDIKLSKIKDDLSDWRYNRGISFDPHYYNEVYRVTK